MISPAEGAVQQQWQIACCAQVAHNSAVDCWSGGLSMSLVPITADYAAGQCQEHEHQCAGIQHIE